MNYAIIFAGGVGSRMGSKTPKQFLEVCGKPIIIHTVEKFATCEYIHGLIIVCNERYLDYCRSLLAQYEIPNILDVIPGGTTGQESIRRGVYHLFNCVPTIRDRDVILIHDGVRPVIDHDLLERSIDCTLKNGSSIAVSNAVETVIRVDENGNLAETIDRSRCRNAKAPQCFFYSDILRAHQRAEREGIDDMIDSATLMNYYGQKLFTTECSPDNIKITTPNDFYMFKGMFEAGRQGEIRQ